MRITYKFLIPILLFLFNAPAMADDRVCQGSYNWSELSPIEEMIGIELLEQFTITTCEIWGKGDGSINTYMMTESDAMVMTRVAMGEAPGSFDDRYYIMWNIKMRAELGFKNAGAGGWDPPTNIWGEPTSIKQEALCWGGCQYAPVYALSNIYFPEELGRGRDYIRGMIAPHTNFQLMNFWLTYLIALEIVDASILDMPVDLRGYDSFKSPQIDWIGTRYWDGGFKNVQFFEYGNIWQDRYSQDNEYWTRLENLYRYGMPRTLPRHVEAFFE